MAVVVAPVPNRDRHGEDEALYIWSSVRGKAGGALCSLRYDLLQRGREPEHPPRRAIALTGLSLLVVAIASASYFTVLGLAGAVGGKPTAVTEQIIDKGSRRETSIISYESPAHTPTATPTPSASRTPSLKPVTARTTAATRKPPPPPFVTTTSLPPATTASATASPTADPTTDLPTQPTTNP